MTPTLSQPVPPKRRSAGAHRRMDLVIGILLGLVIGLAVVSAFVFLGSENSVDAPRLPSHRVAGKARPPSGAPDAAQSASRRDARGAQP